MYAVQWVCLVYLSVSLPKIFQIMRRKKVKEKDLRVPLHESFIFVKFQMVLLEQKLFH